MFTQDLCFSYNAAEARKLAVKAAEEIKEESMHLVSQRVRLIVQVTRDVVTFAHLV